jgi:hypothetical protein
VLSPRGQATVALGLGLYVVSWGFGTPELYAVAIGLTAAPLLALLWLRFLVRPMGLRRRTGERELVGEAPCR